MNTQAAIEALITCPVAVGGGCERGYNGDCGGCNIGDAIALAIQALREKQARENPQPLTLEELRKRDGKPVYIILLDTEEDNKFWVVRHEWTDFYWNCKKVVMFHTEFYCLEDYGETWLAYDYPTKEDESK